MKILLRGLPLLFTGFIVGTLFFSSATVASAAFCMNGSTCPTNYTAAPPPAGGCPTSQVSCTWTGAAGPTTGSPTGAGTTGYRLLEPIPTLNGNEYPDLKAYLRGIYILIIGMAGILAAFMIVIGGLEYIFSALPSAKSDAKNRIMSAVGGLILVLTAWILLYTINPKLLTVGINIADVGTGEKIAGGGPSGSSGLVDAWCEGTSGGCYLTKQQCEDHAGLGSGNDCHKEAVDPNVIIVSGKDHQKFLANESRVRDSLAEAGIDVQGSVSDMCNKRTTNGVSDGCTNVGTLSNHAVSVLKNASNSCGHCITITGGTELGHQTHGIGKDRVDVRYTDAFVQYMTGSTATPPPKKWYSKGDLSCFFEPPGSYNTTTGTHWHCKVSG